jgi:signal transduction histidine kinase
MTLVLESLRRIRWRTAAQRGPSSFGGNPAWWRLPIWAAMTFATVVATHSTTSRIVAGVAMGAASLALQFSRNPRIAVRRAAVLLGTVGGLVACFASHDGIAELAVVIAAARAPDALDGTALRWFTVLDTIAFGGTVGFIARSIPGVLAGAGIPLLVQRAVEHRDLIRERDRAQALLAEVQAGREAETQAVALQERGRIAREMHDVLAHSLAGLSVQLQAVRAVAAREKASDAVLGPLDKAAALAKDGLAEARAAVSALRDPVGLGLDALPALVSRHPGAATLRTVGEPGRLSAEAGHAVYRAVQESLTNAARYAPGSPVTVQLHWRSGALDVAVADDGPAPDHAAVPGQGTGLGLAGMDERIQQVGGTLHAGPRPGSGWQVQLTVPTGSGADPLLRAPGGSQRG